MKAITFFRYSIVLALFAVALLGIFCEPTDDSSAAQWLGLMLLSKGIGAATGYAAYRLSQHWHIFCDDEPQTPAKHHTTPDNIAKYQWRGL